ncbi:MAG: TylF/MycF/NovP-related O-methyltransferase [Bryobacteraceae bacterium]
MASTSIPLAPRRILRFAQRVKSAISNDVIDRVIRQRLTYLDRAALAWIRSEVLRIEAEGIPGSLIETGCALGGSSIVIAASKAPARSLNIYDVFGMIPSPSDKDGADVHRRYEVIASGASKGIGTDEYYGYRSNLLAEVRQYFTRNGFEPEQNSIQFVAGLYEDTLSPVAPLAFAHIDCDWYESVSVCLERIWPCLSKGGSLILDDYFCYSGCRAAAWDYFRNRMDEFTFVNGPRLLIRKV